MKARHVLAGTMMAMPVSSAFAANLASSNFDSGPQGWFAVNGVHSFDWVSSGGDPDGYIKAKDFDSQTLWFFAAPAAYLGDMRAAYGGVLSFALKSDSNSPPLATTYADVHLLGRNGVRLVFAGDAPPVGEWTSYNVALVADGAWRVDSVNGIAATLADFAGVLSDLRQLRIRGDYKQGIETTSLDSVLLSSAPVPEPGTASLWLAGLGAAAAIARRRRA